MTGPTAQQVLALVRQACATVLELDPATVSRETRCVDDLPDDHAHAGGDPRWSALAGLRALSPSGTTDRHHPTEEN